MADAEGVLEARNVSEMPSEQKGTKGKTIKGADSIGWGMKNRLSRLVKPDGHCQFLPIDHGYFQGPTRCLERRGVLRTCVDPDVDTPIILRVSGGTSVVGEDLSNEIITTSVEEMIRLNVAAVGLSIFVGTDYERQSLESLALLINECEDAGIPVMAVTAVGKELEKRTARYLALSCRIAAELGAKIVKTYYCAEDFEKVTNGCPVPVVMAGGPKCETELEVFDFVYDGMQKGAIGVNLGRNVWQNPHPVAMMSALNAVVHDGVTPKQAFDMFKSLQNA
jgi:putative autoinducer-2 (AI-2) aldolase